MTEKENEVLVPLQIDPGYTYADMAEKLSVSRKTIPARVKRGERERAYQAVWFRYK